MPAQIYSIDSVELAILKTDPPTLFVYAKGMVPTSGWTHPMLVPYVYVQPPPDGIWDFGFVAEPPTGIVLPASFPISASHEQPVPSELKGVRVHSSSNAVEQLLGPEPKVYQPLVVKGGDKPFPHGQAFSSVT